MVRPYLEWGRASLHIQFLQLNAIPPEALALREAGDLTVAQRH